MRVGAQRLRIALALPALAGIFLLGQAILKAKSADVTAVRNALAGLNSQTTDAQQTELQQLQDLQTKYVQQVQAMQNNLNQLSSQQQNYISAFASQISDDPFLNITV